MTFGFFSWEMRAGTEIPKQITVKEVFRYCHAAGGKMLRPNINLSKILLVLRGKLYQYWKFWVCGTSIGRNNLSYFGAANVVYF